MVSLAGVRRRAPAVAALSTVLLVLASWWSKARCDPPAGWQGGRQFTQYCYSDLVPLWYGRGLAEGAGPYGAEPLEYPVVLAVRIWLAARGAHLLPGGVDLGDFLAVSAGIAAAEALAVLLLLRRAGLPPARLWWWAAAPALVSYALYNWDLLPVLLLVGAVVAHREGRDGLSGALAGLGVATKLFPGFLVPLVVIACLRQGRRRDAVRHVGAAAAVVVAVNLPAAVLAPQGWRRFLELNRERGPHIDSLWSLLSRVTGVEVSVGALNLLGPALLLAGGVLVVAVGVRRLPPDRTWQLVVPLLVVFLLTNKVFSPQYFLWLVPLMALTLRRAAPFVAAVVADVVVLAVELPFLGGRAGHEPVLPYALMGTAAALRAAALLWVAVEVVRGQTLAVEVVRGQTQESSHIRQDDASASSGTPASTG
jgi:hypothetical protein